MENTYEEVVLQSVMKDIMQGREGSTERLGSAPRGLLQPGWALGAGWGDPRVSKGSRVTGVLQGVTPHRVLGVLQGRGDPRLDAL